MELRGVWVPVVTPMHGDETLDLPGLTAHVERITAAGVDGLVALGTTGEFADIADSERAEVIRTVVGAAGDVPVLAGVGGLGTAQACAIAHDACEVGVNGVLALPPLYWKLDDAQLAEHYARIVAAAGLPVVLYDYPALSGTPLSAALIEQLAVTHDEVIGIKQSVSTLRTVYEVLDRVKLRRPGFSVMLGAAELIAPALLAGADGTIAAIANIDPRPVSALVAAADAGDLDAFREAHRTVRGLLGIPALSRPPILPIKAASAAAGSPIAPVVRTWPANADEVVEHAYDLTEGLLGRVDR